MAWLGWHGAIGNGFLWVLARPQGSEAKRKMGIVNPDIFAKIET
jgi:hypothetical protein